MGVVPELRATDGSRLVGYVLAASGRTWLFDHFDEDWFRNPRAVEWLLDDDRVHRADHRLDTDTVVAAAKQCASTLVEAIQ